MAVGEANDLFDCEGRYSGGMPVVDLYTLQHSRSPSALHQNVGGEGNAPDVVGNHRVTKQRSCVPDGLSIVCVLNNTIYKLIEITRT